MSIFVNRLKELEFLERKYHSNEAELIIIYGRRRIGKTELIQKFCHNKNALYFMGRMESREDTLKRLNLLLIENFKDNKLIISPIQNIASFFSYLAEKSEKRIILVIDEFPFLAGRFPEILSILQDEWDSKFKNTKIMLILSGSSISMMERYAIDYQSPLYGRRTGQWKLTELSIEHLKKFFPNYSMDDIIRIYSSIDAIPGYLVKFSPSLSFAENIKERIFSKGEFLYEEIEILLKEEFRDPSNYMSILSAIAGGVSSFNEICSKTGLDKGLLSKYLGVLENVRVIEKEISITESYKSKLKSKGAIYFLKDNFFDFWFRFVYLNKQELEKGNSEAVSKNNKTEIEEYISRKFEKFSKEFLQFAKLIDYNKIGRWWHKDKEIDIVALNDKTKEILLAECKWQDGVDSEKISRELEQKSGFVDWHNEERKESFAIFAKSFKKKIKEYQGRKVHCLDLKAIEKTLS